jgi:hypothetical protein
MYASKPAVQAMTEASEASIACWQMLLVAWGNNTYQAGDHHLLVRDQQGLQVKLLMYQPSRY